MPLIKIGYLLIRTVAKPVANALKKQTKNHSAFRANCARLAQSYHRAEVRMSRALNNKNDLQSRVKPLDEEKAVELGANFIGEALVFMVAGAILIVDGRISAQKEAARRRAIEDKFSELYSEIEALKKRN